MLGLAFLLLLARVEAQDIFLGKDVATLTQPRVNLPDPGVGQYVANLVTVNMPDATVEKLLDAGLVLGAVPKGVPTGQHPVIFCFGQQKEVHPAVHIGNLPFNWEYSEFIMTVPFVYLNTTGQMKGPYSFAARLFLDNRTHYADAQEAILAGWAYHLAKRPAHIDTTPDIPWGLEDHEYHISDRQDATKSFLHLSAHSTTEWKAPSAFPHFATIGATINNPLVGDTNMLGKTTGKFLCAHFNWHLESAQIAAIKGKLSIDFSFLPGLPTQKMNFVGIDGADFGGFRLRTNWSMGLPDLACQ
jgi:hypothetical protein